MKRTTISINEETKNIISKYGKYGDTPNDVIMRMFKKYEQLKNGKEK